jgi:hypothetical protein
MNVIGGRGALRVEKTGVQTVEVFGRDMHSKDERREEKQQCS